MIYVFLVDKYDCKESLGSQLQIIVALGFPGIIDPPSQLFLRWPYAHKLPNEGVILHILDSFLEAFCLGLEDQDYLGFG